MCFVYVYNATCFVDRLQQPEFDTYEGIGYADISLNKRSQCRKLSVSVVTAIRLLGMCNVALLLAPGIFNCDEHNYVAVLLLYFDITHLRMALQSDFWNQAISTSIILSNTTSLWVMYVTASCVLAFYVYFSASDLTDINFFLLPYCSKPLMYAVNPMM